MPDTKIAPTVRPAHTEETAAGAELIYLSGPELLAYTLGGNESRLKVILAQAFSKPGHLLSYEYAHFILIEEEILGLILGYSGIDKKKATRGSIGTFGSILKLRELLASIRGGLVFWRLSLPVPEDEFYINNFAVLPQAQGQGIGSYLLDWAEQHAKAQGLARCSLDVTIENRHARAVYEHKGFTVQQTRTSRCLRQTGITGVHRMVKALS